MANLPVSDNRLQAKTDHSYGCRLCLLEGECLVNNFEVIVGGSTNQLTIRQTHIRRFTFAYDSVPFKQNEMK